MVKLQWQDHKKNKLSYLNTLIELEVGQQLDSTLLERDMIRLRREPGIAHAYYQVYEQDNGVRVVYGLQENWTIIPYVNFYTTNDDEFAYRLGVTEFNLLGRGIAAGVFYQKDIFDSYGINIRAPILFSKHLGLAIGYQDFTTREPVFLSNGVADYKYNNTSYELSLLYQINLRHRVAVGYSFFNEDYEYLRGATQNGIPQDLDVDKSLVKGIYEYNGLDNYYQYISGFRSIFNAQYVISTDSALPDFIIARNDFLYFTRVGEKGNWANRLRLGLASNDDSPFAPFAVDNNLNIRGVGNTIDRGTGAIVLNTEYRHTAWERDWFVLQTNVFVDAGSWRNPGGRFSDFGSRQNIRVYPGLGLRFIHKQIFNTVFRIDYGVGVTQDSTQGFVFGIGQYF
ncbi:BamA/TamA family outer membrane protein [Nonlabens ponticola]|uniref:outer membrane protein assembly factor n=1 Tax=Nonlabens ponticola TaxID=2496866 RepID=UPI001F493450|nr:outer membrane protein assembly factor [Nonlabens ponticola]